MGLNRRRHDWPRRQTFYTAGVSLSRGVKLVISLLVVAAVVSGGAMTMMYLVVGRPPSVESSSTLVLRPAGDIPELLPEVALPLREGSALTVRGYVDGWYNDVVEDRIEIAGGRLRLPDRPGLGTRLRDDLFGRPNARIETTTEESLKIW